MRLLQRYPITAFYLIAFVMDWIIIIVLNGTGNAFPPLKLPAQYAPTVAALVVTSALSGKQGRRALLGGLGKWRANPLWYGVAIFGAAVLQLVAIGVFVLIDGPGIVRVQFSGLAFLPTLLIGLVLVTGEEIGWRGFALPHMQTRSSPLIASIIIGTLWAAWHIPGDITRWSLLASGHTYMSFLWFLMSTISGSILMAWVYNRTGGSLVLMAIFHLGLTVLDQFVKTPSFATYQFGPYEFAAVLQMVAAAVVVIVTPSMYRRPAQETVATAVGVNRA
jgi:uncharacterized protein